MEVYFFRGMYMKKTVYFGTYTRRISQGIYKAELIPRAVSWQI